MENRSITPLPPADFTTEISKYNTLQPFRYWCHKVLPLVYDDSLSYYELLCKVVSYLNEAIKNVNLVCDDVENLFTAYTQLQDYVNNYFDSTDFQELVDNKLDKMVEDGTLDDILSKLIFDAYYYNVKNYGATGDGVTDDTLAFIKCVRDAEANNKDVLVPSGTYLLTTQVEITGVRVFGIRTKSLVIFDGSTGFVCKQNSMVENLVVQGRNGLFDVVNVNGDNVIVNNCEIIPKQIGVSIGACNNVTINNCYIHPVSAGDGNFGIWSDTEIPPTDVKITNCTINDFWLNAIFAHMNGGIIDSCYFRNNHLQVQPTGGGHLDIIGANNDSLVRTVISNNVVAGGNSVTAAFEIDANRVLITGNYVYDIQGWGVTIQNRVGVHVIGNYFQNVVRCISTADNMTDFNIVGNYAELIETFIMFGSNNKRFAITGNVLNQVTNVHNLDKLPLGVFTNNTPDYVNSGLRRVVQVGETISVIDLDGSNNYYLNFYFGATMSKLCVTPTGQIVTQFDSAQNLSDTDVENKLYIFIEDNTVKIKNNISGNVTMYVELDRMIS